MNKHERGYIAELERALADRADLTPHEKQVLRVELEMLSQGSIGLTGPQTVEERLERLRDHYP